MECKEVLKELCTAHAPSGRENWLYNTIENIFKDFGDISIDNLNNIFIHKKGSGSGKIMLMAHADEVFLIVTDIDENGFLKFKGNGIDIKTLINQQVFIHGKEKINGIVSIKSKFSTKGGEKNKDIDIDSLFIDTGFTYEVVKDIVSIGDYVTLNRDFYELLNNKVTCKAIDDRAGIATLYECGKELMNSIHNMNVYFVCSSQEEVGHRGARTASYNIQPDLAIALDVTFDSGKFGDSERENKLGEGPVICIGPNIHPQLRDSIMKLAKEYNISFQVEVEPGNTGTDAWDIQITRTGIPTLLISIPIRYMHTSVEVIDINDIKNTGRLIAKFIQGLDYTKLEEIVCF
ncbi:M42 family metallopeptidase [Clostridium rectalis]|uniref:M42 family metallopeptidase n=1 Tax=Clostridium rectalis TaxID=2040295 RepID=UPI000F62CB1E|nr:M42 family metallopeptidase [Clostridium rectalis]